MRKNYRNCSSIDRWMPWIRPYIGWNISRNMETCFNHRQFISIGGNSVYWIVYIFILAIIITMFYLVLFIFRKLKKFLFGLRS